MGKLSKEEGFSLVKKLFNNHLINEHGTMEDRCDIRDTVMMKCGERIYSETLKWAGGSSYDEKQKFHKQLREVYKDCEREFDEDFTCVEDISEVAAVIFELTLELIDFIDTDSKMESVVQYEKPITETYTFAQCPNCTKEIQTRGQGIYNCNSCRKRFLVVLK